MMWCVTAAAAAIAICCLTSSAQGQVINTTDCGDGAVTMWATWAPWSMVGPCSVQCVGETGEQSRRRTRGCPVSVMTCDATQVELEYFACMGDGTPVAGGVGQWSQWADTRNCPAECGDSRVRQRRSRACDDPPPSCGGPFCPRFSSRQFRIGTCSSGPCGGLCPSNSGREVLLQRTDTGFFLLCFRGTVTKIRCPRFYTFRLIIRYGYQNVVRIFRLCNNLI